MHSLCSKRKRKINTTAILRKKENILKTNTRIVFLWKVEKYVTQKKQALHDNTVPQIIYIFKTKIFCFHFSEIFHFHFYFYFEKDTCVHDMSTQSFSSFRINNQRGRNTFHRAGVLLPLQTVFICMVISENGSGKVVGVIFPVFE